MAKIKFGAIVTDASGKLGGHVFSKNKAGSYMRTKVTPLNPKTAAQMAIRGIFAGISSAWSGLTAAQRSTFLDKVADYSKTNIFGDSNNPTGKALFQRLNQNLVITGQTQVTTCPSPIAVPFANATGAAGAATGQTLALTLAGLTTGSKLIVFATPSMSQGTQFVKNKLRMLGTFPGAAAGPVAIGPKYITKFGALVAGSNVVIGVRVVNAQGQASPMETIKAVIAI